VVFNVRRRLKLRAILENVRCMIGNTAEAWHAVAQGQAVTCCECGSVVVRL
jgi:hypothetical protein